MTDLPPARHELVTGILADIGRDWQHAFPTVAAYVVGSGSRRADTSPKDLDLFFVDLAIDDAVHDNQFRRLVECLESGDPFDGAFDAADSAFRDSLLRIIRPASDSVALIHVDVTFAFGPARKEVGIADDALHVHVSGPFSLGDLVAMTQILPFHALAFRQYHRILAGPPLTSLIPPISPSLDDLRYWDKLAVRRFQNAPIDAARRKWVARMLSNRRDVPEYLAQHSSLVERCAEALPKATASEMASFVELLVSSAQSG